MSKRWLVAGCLILSSVFAAAQDSDVISAPGIPLPAPLPLRDVPILTSTAQDGNSATHFQATIDPLITTRAPGATGDLADSADQNVDFGWHIPIFSMFTIGYDTAVNAFRQDQAIWDDEEATSSVTSSLANKISLQVQSGPKLKWTGYVQAQRSATDGDPGYSDATKYGTEAAWTPVKDVTTVKAQASTQETVNFNHSILDQQVYTTALDQKLPWLPLTLHTAGSVTEDTVPLLAASSSNSTIIDASLLWKIDPTTSWSNGVQRQDGFAPATVQLANTDVVFTQISLQPADAWTVSMRAAHEQTDTTASGQYLSTNSDVLFTFGLTWTLGDRFKVGAGINYRALQSVTPAATPISPPASVSLSAGGNF